MKSLKADISSVSFLSEWLILCQPVRQPGREHYFCTCMLMSDLHSFGILLCSYSPNYVPVFKTKTFQISYSYEEIDPSNIFDICSCL